MATPDEEELVWERLAPPTRDDTRRPHEVSMDVDDAPPALPLPPPRRPPASPRGRQAPPLAARGSVRGAPPTKMQRQQHDAAGSLNVHKVTRRGSRPAGRARMKNVADLPEQRAVALPGALPREVDVP